MQVFPGGVDVSRPVAAVVTGARESGARYHNATLLQDLVKSSETYGLLDKHRLDKSTLQTVQHKCRENTKSVLLLMNANNLHSGDLLPFLICTVEIPDDRIEQDTETDYRKNRCAKRWSRYLHIMQCMTSHFSQKCDVLSMSQMPG